MTEKELPNIFVALELDPGKPWNQAEFERQLQKKRQEWSRSVNHPSKKGMIAKRYLNQIPDIQAIAADETLRQSQANTAKKEGAAAETERKKLFEEQLKLLQAKGHVLEEEVSRLVKDYADIFSKRQIEKKIKVDILKQENTSGSAGKPILDTTKAKGIKDRLETLNKGDLYDFLGLSQTTQSYLIRSEAQSLYDSIQKKGTKTTNDTLIVELCGFCLDIFKTEDERAKYDETLRLQVYDALKKNADAIAAVSKQIEASQLEALLRKARSARLNTDEAFTTLKTYARQKGYSLVIDDETVDFVRNQQLCGNCQHLNKAEEKYCTQCGTLLKEPCPKCQQPIASEAMACGSCGFPIGNRGYVGVLINDSEAKFDERDFSAAAELLKNSRRIWPKGGQDSLNQKLDSLEQRIVPKHKEQLDFLAVLADLVKQKKFFTARNYLAGTADLFPSNDDKTAVLRVQIDAEINKAQEKVTQASRLSTTQSEQRIQYYQQALEISQDYQEARARLAETPPDPPTDLEAVIKGQVVHLNWTPSISSGVQHIIVRKALTRPTTSTDGQQLATTSARVFDDAKAEVGLPLFYAVFADRSGVSSKDAAIIAKPVMVIHDVTQLQAHIDDEQIQLSWKAPANVFKFVIRRSEHMPPMAIQDGQPISILDNNKAVDNNVKNGVRYYYTVFCQYKDDHDRLKTTRGLTIDAVPQQPPQPINDLRIKGIEGHKEKRIQLSWTAPEKGETAILKARKHTGLGAGTTIPLQRLRDFGQILSASSSQLLDMLSELGFYYYLPVVIFQDMAYIGQEKVYACVDDVTDLSAQNMGHLLRLQWRWPKNCQEAIVAYSHERWPDIDAPEAIKIHLTRAEYDLHGHYDVHNPTSRDYHIIVFALISQNGEQIRAAGQSDGSRFRISLASRIKLNYEIKKSWVGKKLTLHINIKGKGNVPALQLVGKSVHLPMNKSDGEVLLRLEAQPIENENLQIPLDQSIKRPQLYARLFLEDDYLYDRVTIQHPERDKLKVFN